MFEQRVRRSLGFAAVLVVLAAPVGAQSGQISGRVSSQETGQPLGAVQVFIDGSTRGTITRADGSYALANVPSGTYTVVAQSIGYQVGRQQNVQVASGGSVTVNFQLVTNVLALQEVVATGLIDPVEGVRSPITTARVTRAMVPVMPVGAPTAALQGRVAGAQLIRTSGQPGADINIVLRTPTSIRGSNTPLIVVDGVILGSSAVDIESMDVESIEVIKGAAASSLYGSRAAAGVVAITTNRGRNLAAGQTRFMARSEIGRSFTGEVPQATHHFYAINPVTGNYVNQAGRDTTRAGRFAPAVAFMDKPYPPGTQLYDNLGTLYRAGGTNSHTFSIAQNSENTNFSASLNRWDELGSLEGNRGYERNAFRVNLDHRFLNTFNLGISGYHSRSYRDELVAGLGLLSSAFWAFLATPPDIDLSRKDENGNFIMQPDPDVLYENPIWRQNSRESETWQNRTLANATLRWSPFPWLSTMGEASYDRNDWNFQFWLPVGTPLSVATLQPATGQLTKTNGLVDTFNYTAQAQIRRDFGPLNARTTFRGLYEKQVTDEVSGTATDFFVQDVKRLTPAASRSATSQYEEYRASGYLIDTALDYDGKYIVSGLVRRDGSSLFGPENRWHSYYRVAGAWRLSEEPWFDLPRVDEFKLKASRGTAGGRPAIINRFETWNATATGVSKGQLGNVSLAPEHTVENEVGLEMIFLGNRASLELVHAWQETTNSLVSLPVSAITGYSSQWVNSGAMGGHTTEFKLDAQVLSRPGFNWFTTLIADRSRSKITQWDQACIIENISMVCEGASLRDINAFRFWRGGRDQLPAWLATHQNEFDVNDEGYWVWVGAGNSFRDGIAKNLWGTTTSIGGESLTWGYPIVQRNDRGTPVRQMLGSGDPDVNLGLMNNVSWGNFGFHAHLHAALGQQMLNDTRKNLTVITTNNPGSAQMEQVGKPDELKKPVGYYTVGFLQAGLPMEEWLEDSSYLKLRALQVRYNLRRDRLQQLGLSRLGTDLIAVAIEGRDLYTWTNYWGFDPEAGLIQTNRVAPLNWYSYPPRRTISASIEVNF